MKAHTICKNIRFFIQRYSQGWLESRSVDLLTSPLRVSALNIEVIYYFDNIRRNYFFYFSLIQSETEKQTCEIATCYKVPGEVLEMQNSIV